MDLEIYLTIEELAVYLKITEQTIRRWILNREIPFHKIKSVIRFRLSEIEKWIDNSGINNSVVKGDVADGDLFCEETNAVEVLQELEPADGEGEK